MKRIVLLTLSLIAIGCAHENCNNLPQRPQVNANVSADAAAAKAEFAAPLPSPSPADPNSAQVFKATGERQCGQAAATPIEAMQTTLTSKGISVAEAHTQADGLMHMALCGSPSGQIHVFQIKKKDLKKAQKLGFKVFVPQS